MHTTVRSKLDVAAPPSPSVRSPKICSNSGSSYEIYGFHDRKNMDCDLLGCNATQIRIKAFVGLGILIIVAPPIQ